MLNVRLVFTVAIVSGMYCTIAYRNVYTHGLEGFWNDWLTFTGSAMCSFCAPVCTLQEVCRHYCLVLDILCLNCCFVMLITVL